MTWRNAENDETNRGMSYGGGVFFKMVQTCFLGKKQKKICFIRNMGHIKDVLTI